MSVTPQDSPLPARDRVADRLMLAGISRRLLGPQPSAVPKIGRFVVLDELGAGGMGQVFRAYDPELDRQIALKVLRPDPDATEERTVRLKAEAMALARLSHPNVVSIFEVGLAGSELFLAMELVDGDDLDGWARRHPVSKPLRDDARQREVLGLLLQAGRGLAAAHAAGLVHRDFKPSNVLVGKDGRVRVADFGLARAGPHTVSSEATQPSAASGSLTQTGAVLGTPRYMSPEQQRSGRADARSDQLAFCVTAWEVLFGRHPWFGGPPDRELPGRPDGAPARLVDTLLRGLAAEPEARYRSLEELLDDLQPRASAGAGRWRMPAGVALVAGVAAAWAGLREDEPDPCAGLEAELADIWGGARRELVGDTFNRSAVPSAALAWERVAPTLDAYADHWTAQRIAACEAAPSQGATTSAASLGCLAHRRRALVALVDVLQAGSPEAISQAPLNAMQLPDVNLCGEADYVLDGFEPPNPEDVDRVEAARAALAEATALRKAGRLQTARARIVSLDTAVSELNFPPLARDYAHERGKLASQMGELVVEEEQLLAAYARARRLGSAAVAVDASSRLAVALADRGELEAARRWLSVAEAGTSPEENPRLHADVLERAGGVQLSEGDAEAAVGTYRRALALQGGVGERSVELVRPVRNLGVALRAAGRYDEARETLERALGLARTLGPRHPLVASVLHGLGALALELEDYPAVEGFAREELEIYRATFGDENPNTATALISLGAALSEQGRLEQALEALEQADGIYERAGEAHRRDRVYALQALASVSAQLGERDLAVDRNARALAILRELVPDAHPDIAAAVAAVAFSTMAQGKPEAALRLYREARDRIVRTMGAEHLDVAVVLGGLGATLMYLDRYPEAEAALTEQLEVIEANLGQEHSMRAQPLYNLGLCAEAGAAFERATEHYEASLAALTANGDPGDPALAYPLIGLARVGVAQGESSLALPAAERALALLEGGNVKLRADASAVLAQALWLTKTDRPRARELADAADAGYGRVGAEAQADREKLARWRSEHGL